MNGTQVSRLGEVVMHKDRQAIRVRPFVFFGLSFLPHFL